MLVADRNWNSLKTTLRLMYPTIWKKTVIPFMSKTIPKKCVMQWPGFKFVWIVGSYTRITKTKKLKKITENVWHQINIQ